MADKKLEYGLQPPKGVDVAWGARAIFSMHIEEMIDIVWDRQDAFGPQKEVEELVRWVRTKGLPALEEKIWEEGEGVVSRTNQKFTVKDGIYTIQANPKRSGGYLYIAAWKKDKPGVLDWSPR